MQEAHLQTVIEVLQSIKASEMTPMLQRIYGSPGGSESLDVLMKYLYKGMAGAAAVGIAASATGGSGGGPGSAPRTPTRGSMTPQQTGGFSQAGGRPGAAGESTGAAMSVLLSWHEKVVEVAGLGCIGRCMTDWRKV
jgi:actin related protein 2/3 complex subunit 5